MRGRRSHLSFRLTAELAALAVFASGFLTATELLEPPVAKASAVYPSSAPTVPAATSLAKESGRRVLVDGLTTETDQTWANADGTLTMDRALGIERKRQPDGSWADVDLTLERGDKSVASRMPAVPVAYGVAGSSTIASTVLDGERVSVGWEDPLPEPVVDGTRAIYSDVRPGIDLVAEAIRSGFELSFVVKAKPSSALSLPLSLMLPSGWSASQGLDGALKMVNSAGTVMGRGAAPVVFGAERDATSNLPAMSEPVPDLLGSVTNATGGRTTRLWTLMPSPSFFADPRVTYPVTVDPIYYWSVSSDTYVKTDVATSQSSATRLYIGTNNGVAKARTLIHMSSIPTDFLGKHVLNGSLKMFNSYSSSCYVGPESAANLWRTNSWSSGVLWATKPTDIDLQSSNQFTHGAPNGCGGGPATASMDLTAVAQGWAAGTVSTRDFTIRGGSETDTRSWKEFYSAETCCFDIPTIEVTYNTPPVKPYSLRVAPCAGQCADPALTNYSRPYTYATGDDADGGVLLLEFEYWEGTSSTPSNRVGYTTTYIGAPSQGLVVPPTNLLDGTYEMRVRSQDGYDASPWSDWFHFSIDTVAPAVGTLGSTWPRSAWSSASSGSFSWTPGDSTVASYQYRMDGAPWVPTSASTLQASYSGIPDGWHSFTVAALDTAGNWTTYPSYVFGVGNGAITSPAIGDRTSDSVTLTAQAPSGAYTYVRYQWAQGTTPSPPWQTIGFGSLLAPGTSTPAPVTSNGTYPVTAPLTWKATDQLRIGALEVRACFATDANSAPTTCSGPNTLQTEPAAFGPTYATAPMGTGSLALQTGDLSLNSTDVSLASYDGQLTIGRTFTTLDPANARGQLLPGPQHDIETDLTSFISGYTTLSSATAPTTLGSRSLKLAPSGDASGSWDTFAALGGDTGALRLGVQPGSSYTLSGWEYVPAATGLTPDQYVRGERLVAFTRVGSGSYAETQGTAPTTVNAWNPVSVTFRVPTGATEAFIRLYNGFASTKTGSEVYYDNFTLSRTDVFGPGWTSALPGPDAGAADLSLEDDSSLGYVMLTGSDGAASMYLQNDTSNTFSGVGDATDGSVLTKVSGTQFTLADTDGTITTWTSPSSGVWQVQSVVEPGDAHTTSYTYDADGRAVQILGPIPPGVTCATPLTTVGCRTLTLTYASSTSATGTSNGTWGDFAGQLRQVSFTAADPLNGNSMTTTPVASYLYDNTGRLRTAWDPRVPLPLKTTYTYAADGRLAILTPPGLNAFTFSYDLKGRLSTVSRTDPAGGSDVQSVVYDVPLSGTVNGATAPIGMDSATLSTWGQTSDLPQTAIAVFPPSHIPAGTTPATVTSTDWPYADLHYLDGNGREVNTASYGAGAWQISASTYDSTGNVVRSLSPGARDEALHVANYPNANPQVVAASSTAQRSSLLDIQNAYSIDGTELLGTIGPIHSVKLANGTIVDARSHTSMLYDEGAPSGGPYRLVTTSASAAQTPADGVDHDPLITTTGYGAIGVGDPTGWSLRLPTSTTTVMASDQPNITRVTRYDPQGRVIETRMPAGVAGGDAHSSITTYYTAGTTSGCVNSAMAGLPCQVSPAAQPTSGPALPVTTTAYDRWTNPIIVTESANGATRTSTTRYDDAGRPCLSMVDAGTTLTALPATYTGYDDATGLPKITGTLNSVPSICPGSTPILLAQVTTDYDADGRVVAYHDANGNVATTTYTADGQVAQTNDGLATTTFGYDSASEHRGLLMSQNDGQAGTFSATYDAAGQQTSRTYPNSLVATVKRDETGDATSLTYVKNSSTWMTFTAIHNAHDQVVSQSAPTSSQTFGYDNAGRLINVADSDSTSGSTLCTTRTYTYDQDSNRVAQHSYAPAANGSCSTITADTTLSHSYDQADRLTDLGYNYDDFGNTSAFIEAPLDYGTGADGPLVVDGATHPWSNPLLLAGSVNYTSVTLQNGGWIGIAPDSGGVLQLKARDSLSICTSCGITGTGMGNAGAPSGSTPAGAGPGGGYSGTSRATYGGGGGGASAATTGQPGGTASGTGVVNPGPGGAAGPTNGDISGTPTLSSLLGSGGGAGGDLKVTNTIVALGGAGGAGGGVLRISAPTIDNLGAISSGGTYGLAGARTSTGSSGGGGGGSGGSVWLSANTVNLPGTQAHIYVTEGGGYHLGADGNYGGPGGRGHVRLDAVKVSSTAAMTAGQLVQTSPQLGTFSYYANNMVASHTINGVTNSWTLDPGARQRVETHGATGVIATNHYADTSDSPAWVGNSNNTWTRNVQGLDGALSVLVDSSGTQTLQLANLHGDVVATAPNSTSATGIATYNESTEFGTPRSGTDAKYGWLGAHRRANDTLGGLVLMGVRLYNPTSGRFLQTDPVRGGSANAYDYVNADPINNFDLDGRFCGPRCRLKRLKNAASSVGRTLYAHSGDIALGLSFAAVIATGGAATPLLVAAASFSSVSAARHFSRGEYADGLIDSVGAFAGAGEGAFKLGSRMARLGRSTRSARISHRLRSGAETMKRFGAASTFSASYVTSTRSGWMGHRYGDD